MEQSFVAWAKMRARRLPQVKLGIGDDAAVLEQHASDTVITTDSQMDGVHFQLGEVDPRRVGRKLVNVNLSDLAAMAAQPECVFLSMCLPMKDGPEQAEQLAADVYEGICDALEPFGVAIAGGDTNCWDGPLALNLTAVGRVVDEVVWRRDGVQPEDAIVVTGPLGGSILGKHLDFTPQVQLAADLRGAGLVHAAMDISDGLSVDLLRMCDASGCGAVLNLQDVPVSAAAKELAESSGKLPVEHALGDGEDFELLLSVAQSDLPKLREIVGEDRAIVCGEFTSRTGLWANEGGKIRQLTSSGYVHGR